MANDKAKTSNENSNFFDVLVKVLVSIYSYLWFGIKKIFSFIVLVVEYAWRYCIQYMYAEIVKFVMALYTGFAFVCSFLFITIPSKFSKLFQESKTAQSAVDKLKVKKVDVNEAKGEAAGKSSFEKLSEYFTKKYNELSFVQEQQKKKIEGLEPLVLDSSGPDGNRSPVKLVYRYLALDENGKLVKGYFAAFSKVDVYSYLTDAKMTIYEIETNKAINFLHAESNSMRSKMSTKDLVFWLAQLATYIKAGIPLTDAVKILSQQDKRRKYKTLYDEIIYELTMGEPFSEALRKQGNAFPSLLVNMIKSAEMTGTIENTLDEMSNYYQEILDTKKAIISSITYPCIVLTFAGAVVIFMLVYLVPKFEDVYDSMNAEVTGLTAVVIQISHFLQNNWSYILLVFAGIIVAYMYLFKNIKAFKTIMQSFFMRLPVVGRLIISKEMNMFARTFASLQKNNILLTDSIDILAKITSNEIYKELELRTIENLMRGNKMSDTFKNHWAIPDVAYFMIVTGESTGELSSMLDKVADFYAKEEKNAVGAIKTFTEPVLILFLAIVVGFILVSILVPMFGVYGQVS